MRHFVITFIGPDRTGVVEDIAVEIRNLGGNWLESRLGHLEGKFAGLISVDLPEAAKADLTTALEGIAGGPWGVQVEASAEKVPEACPNFEVNLVGPDRSGIVGEISGALAETGVSIVLMDSLVESAPFSGEALFKARLEILAPDAMDINDLRQCLEPIADAMTLDLDIEPRP